MAKVDVKIDPQAQAAIKDQMVSIEQATQDDLKKTDQTQDKHQQETKQSDVEKSDSEKSPTHESDNDSQTELRQKSSSSQQTQSRDRSAQSQRNLSEFKPQENPNILSRLPEKLGHKIELTTETTHTTEQAQSSESQSNQTSSQNPQRALTPERQQQLLRLLQNPKPESYKSVLQESLFRGPLRQTPLAQKLQRMFERAQAQQTQAHAENPEMLTRSEVLQLFEGRRRAENKEQFREVLRHELAKYKAEQAKQRVQAFGEKKDSSGTKSKIDLSSDHRFEKASQKLQSRLELKSALSKFEEILKNVLKGKKSVPDLPDGVRARFQSKTNGEWSTFFNNTKNLGSVLESDEQNLNQLIESLFRGIFVEEGNESQTKIITDLAFSFEGEVIENKFAQLLLKNPKLLEQFQKLTPGDVIPQELLKLLGDELQFLKLVHQADVSFVSEQEKKQFLNQMKQQQSRESKNRLEDALIRKREQNDSEQTNHSQTPLPFDPRQISERDKSSPKFFIFVLYATGAITLIFLLGLIFKNIF